MTVLSIDSANKIYECAQSVTITQHKIKSPYLGKFCSNVYKLERDLNESSKDDYWRDFLRPLKHFRFRLCAAPYQVNWLECYVGQLTSQLVHRIRRCKEIYPNFTDQAQTLVDDLHKLPQHIDNPMLDFLTELSTININSTIAWVVKESRFISEVEDILKFNYQLSRIAVLHPSELNSDLCFDELIVIGSPRWFSESVFLAPRARQLHIVHYNWMNDAWKPEPTFSASYKPQRSSSIHYVGDSTSTEEIELPVESILPSLEYITISEAGQEQHRNYDEIEARCLILEDDWAVFVEADESEKFMIVDLDKEDTDRVKRIPLREIVSGTFIVMRTGGGGDYIIPVADRIMGKGSTKARRLQQEWKTRLRRYVEKRELFETCCDLLELGSQIADEVNVRNWMFPRSIKTRDFRDFLAIMRLIGLEEQAQEYWQQMGVISNAHQKAGRELSKLLLEQIDEIDTTELLRRGRMQVKLAQDNMSSLTVFRVKYLLREVFRVPYSKLGEPFRMGNYAEIITP